MQFYRASQIGDFVFGVFAAAGSAYMGWRHSTRIAVCEELSRQPELMHSLTEMGLSLENCERWFERAVMAFVACMVIVLVARVSHVRFRSRSHHHSSLRLCVLHPSIFVVLDDVIAILHSAPRASLRDSVEVGT